MAPRDRRPYVSVRAFTILEVLAAAVITAILFLAVFYGFATGFRIINTTRENMRATQIIESRMEGLRLEAWGTNQLFNTSFVPLTFTDYFYPFGLTAPSNRGAIYYGTMSITKNMGFTTSYSDNMALVTVTVQWTDNHDGVVNVHTRTMETYVAEFGLQNYVWAQ